MGRSPKSSSIPRSSTQVTPGQPQACHPPTTSHTITEGAACGHSDKWDRLAQSTGEALRPWAGPGRSRQSLSHGGQSGPDLDGQLSGPSERCGSQSLKLRGSRPAPSPGAAPPARSPPFSATAHCTLQCIRAHAQLEPAHVRGPLLQPAVWVHVPFRLRCSLGGPRSCCPPETLASRAYTQSL